MSATTQVDDALQTFVDSLGEETGLAARSLARAWQSGGGTLQVGQVAIRLTATDRDGATYTAATIFAAPPRLELCRVILGHHGVGADAWTHWVDEAIDAQVEGFDPATKYPTLELAALTPTRLARLVSGLRDLAAMVSG